MISHKHQCIFVHIPKCAGTSIEKLFLKDLGIDYQYRLSLLMGKNNNRLIGPPRLAHLTISEMLKNHLINETQLRNYFSFAVIRNPIDRVFSFYRYLGYNNVMNINNFIIKVILKSFKTKDSNYWFLKPQSKYIMCDGKIVVKELICIKDLSKKINYIKSKSNLNKDLVLTHENKSIKTFSIFKSLKFRLKYFRLMDCVFWFGEKNNQAISAKNLKILEKLYKEDFELLDL